MATLKEFAQGYTPTAQMKNIADLESFDINVEIQTEEKQNKEGENYKVNYIIINDEQYRVPGVVIRDLKSLMEKIGSDKIQKVSVIKTGSGMDTRYQVLPLGVVESK